MNRQNILLKNNPVILFCAAIFCFILLTPQAQASSALQWLATQTNIDSSYASVNDIATPYQSTAETLRTFHDYNIADPNVLPARQLLNAELVQNTEYLARRIISAANAKQDPQLILEQLLLHQSVSGGFGEFSGYDSGTTDTSYALEAFAVAELPISSEIALTVSFLLNQQNGDGGWSASKNSAGDSSVFVTAITLKALSHYRGAYNLEPAIDQGKSYLLAQQNVNALWDEPFLSALSISSYHQ